MMMFRTTVCLGLSLFRFVHLVDGDDDGLYDGDGSCFTRASVGSLSRLLAPFQPLPHPPQHTTKKQVFMDIEYKDGTRITDDEVTGLLIALLFAGQHTSSITSSWTALYLANNK